MQLFSPSVECPKHGYHLTCLFSLFLFRVEIFPAFERNPHPVGIPLKGIQKIHSLRFRDGGIIAKRFPCFACQHERLCDDCASAPKIGGVVVGQGSNNQVVQQEEEEEEEKATAAAAEEEVVESGADTTTHVNDLGGGRLRCRKLFR